MEVQQVPLTRTKIWQALERHYAYMATQSLHDLFSQNPLRTEHYCVHAANITLDYAHTHCQAETLALLIQLAEQSQVSAGIARLFDGGIVNTSEGRPALHTALRSQHEDSAASSAIVGALLKMEAWVDAIRAGVYYGFSGKPIKNIINMGIGGSESGPDMLFSALAPDHVAVGSACPLNFYFVSSLERAEITACLSRCQPEQTLFIIVSKSFSTSETLSNLSYAMEWIKAAAQPGQDIRSHFIAVTAAPASVVQYGLSLEQVLPFWDGVGGRYSVWSAVGFIAAIAVGMTVFKAFLAGGEAMDRHFRAAPLAKNMPVLLALMGIWYNNFFNFHTQAIIPYCQALHLLPHYLQQLHMESLGKSTQINGQPVDYPTGGVVWGGVATNSQHTFHQLLLQGTLMVPTDFIVPLKPVADHASHEEMMAHFLAQSDVFSFGYQSTVVDQHQVITGNRPHHIIFMDRMNAHALGALIALYEHKVYVQSIIWRINAFDQWGVQRGKQLTPLILQRLRGHMDQGAITPRLQKRIDSVAGAWHGH